MPVTYAVDSTPNAVSFITQFEQETVLLGYPKAHLWVKARGADKMDLFVLVQKLAKWGTALKAFTVLNRSAIAHDLTERRSCATRDRRDVYASPPVTSIDLIDR